MVEQQRKLLSGVLAGFQPEAQVVNPTWRQLCESLSNDMDDRPYLKAIFAYIASRDWRKVLDEEFLPLRERVAVALRVLSDEQVIMKSGGVIDIEYLSAHSFHSCR